MRSSLILSALCAMYATASPIWQDDDLPIPNWQDEQAEVAPYLAIRSTSKVLNNSHALWHDMKYFTNFSFAAFQIPCAVPPWGAVVQNYYTETMSNTQVTIYRDDRTKQLILSFAGTEGYVNQGFDGAQNMVPLVGTQFPSCFGCLVHNGFLGSYLAAANDVAAGIANATKYYPKYALRVTSHSTGAAIASLASMHLRGLGYSFTTMTFGQPRVGNAAYANLVDAQMPYPKYLRVTHYNDGTAQWPSTLLGYQHESTEFWQSVSDYTQDGPNNTYHCFGQEPTDCNNAITGQIDNDAHNFYSGLVMYRSCIGPANLTFTKSPTNL